jgi:excinuclease ABC subunit B
MARSPKTEAAGVSDVSAKFIHDVVLDGELDAATPMLWQPHRPARPDKSEGGKRFKLVSDYEPAGDQPTAIAELVAGLKGRKTTRCCWASPARARPSPWPRSSRPPSAPP